MTPALARIVRELVKEGATVLGPKPVKSPSLAGYPACDAEVRSIADEVWGEGTVESSFGKGRVIPGEDVIAALTRLALAPDCAASDADTPLSFVHRRTDSADVYFVASRESIPRSVVCTFRVGGRLPELWDADKGTISEASIWKYEKGLTSVRLDLEQSGSMFVVFRHPAKTVTSTYKAVSSVAPAGEARDAWLTLSSSQRGTVLHAARGGRYVLSLSAGGENHVTVPDIELPVRVDGAWDISFQSGRGAPEKAVFEKLISWPDHADRGIKYFSGTAAYRKCLDIPPALLGQGRELYLDLGQVQVIAEVKLNGRNLGILWKAPYRLDITSAAKAGKNELEIEITNLWPNRLIGDEQLPEDIEWPGKTLLRWPDWLLKGEPRPSKDRVTFTTWHHWRKDMPLQPSGLLGPVVLIPLAAVPVK